MSGDAADVDKGDTLDRRSFLGRAAALLGVSAWVPGGGGAWAAAPRLSLAAVGVQLYTLRSLLAESVADALDVVAGIGYGEVELAGLHGLAPADFRSLLDARGLAAPSTHVGLDALAPDRLTRTLDTAEILGHRWVIVPSLTREQLAPEGLGGVIETLERAGTEAGRRGIGVGFHNHAAEFTPGPDGRRPLHRMIAETDPALVSFQLDVYWAVEAGHDPLALLRAHPGRFISLHLKDRTPAGEMVAVGDGAIDFAALLVEAGRQGVRHAFVEHDRPDDPARSVARSYRHLRTILS